jgi:hypothetical protein
MFCPKKPVRLRRIQSMQQSSIAANDTKLPRLLHAHVNASNILIMMTVVCDDLACSLWRMTALSQFVDSFLASLVSTIQTRYVLCSLFTVGVTSEGLSYSDGECTGINLCRHSTTVSTANVSTAKIGRFYFSLDWVRFPLLPSSNYPFVQRRWRLCRAAVTLNRKPTGFRKLFQ